MIYFLIIGGLILAVGLLMIFAPDKLNKLNDVLNKPVFKDRDVFNNKLAFSVIFLSVGLLLIFTYLQYVFS